MTIMKGKIQIPTDGKKIVMKGSGAFVLGLIIGLLLLNIVGLPVVVKQSQGGLLRFSSYNELREFLNKSMSSIITIYGEGGLVKAKSTPLEYSKTNIQVEGVDEADIVKTDGKYIYYASNKNLFIVKAYPPENAEVLSKITFNGTIRGLFIKDDRLIVFEEYSKVWPIKAEKKPSHVIILPIMIRRSETRLWIYNMARREKPVPVREISVNGSYFTSRMIGNYVYLIVSQPAYLIQGKVFLPSIKYDGHVEEVKATQIYYSNTSDRYYAFTIVLSVNVMSDESPAYKVFLVGAAGTVYVSTDNIYITVPGRVTILKKTGSLSERTQIHRISIQNGKIEYKASGEVPGRVLNQFSMDEYNGYFRIATTIGYLSRRGEESTSTNNIYIMNLNLTIVGRLERIAPGERIYSARFMGDRCYLVTFRKVDPFFVIDLKDPRRPKVLGWLKITGYSSYLHPYDENHIIGIGKETVAAEEGNFAWYQGVKISLFDVSNVSNPVEIGKYEIGDRGTDSPVLRDHKSLLFDRKKGIMVIPVLVAEIDEKKYPNGVPPNVHGEYVWQGAYVFRISQRELTMVGRITHIKDLGKISRENILSVSKYFVKRAVYIDNVLYTISDGKIKMNSLTDLHEINEIYLR